MQKTSLEKAINGLRPWHFLVDLGDNNFTIPRYEWKDHFHRIIAQDYMARSVLPMIAKLCANVPDTSIVDIGCNEGWFSTLLAQQGYKEVVGIDPQERNILKANFLKEHFGLSNVKYEQESVASFICDKRFDIVLLFGVINHIHDPVGTFEKIHSIVDNCLVLDLDLLCGEKYQVLNSDFQNNNAGVSGAMACHFEKSHETTSSENKLVFQYSEEAIVNMLNYVGFSPVLKVEPSLAYPEHYRSRNRLMLIAHKQKKSFMSNDMLVKSEYVKAKKHIETATPVLVAEGISSHNIVQFADYYIAIPQNVGSFDLYKILEFDCMISNDQDVLEKAIASGAGARARSDRDFINLVTYDLCLQGQYEQALLAANYFPENDIEQKSFKLVTFAKINMLNGDLEVAKQFLDKSLGVNPNSASSLELLQYVDDSYSDLVCHRLFV